MFAIDGIGDDFSDERLAVFFGQRARLMKTNRQAKLPKLNLNKRLKCLRIVGGGFVRLQPIGEPDFDGFHDAFQKADVAVVKAGAALVSKPLRWD